jgi:hypothetical protein
MIFSALLEIFSHYWEILGLFEARSWEEVRRWLPTSGLYKPCIFEAMGEISGGSEQVYDARLLSQRPLLCTKAIEEQTFVGHFWEPHSYDLGVVSFDGFLRSGRK